MDIIAELKELEKKYIYVSSELETLGSDEWAFKWTITYLPKEAWELKRRATSLVSIGSFKGGGGTYSGAWDTQEEALTEGIKYAKEKLLQ